MKSKLTNASAAFISVTTLFFGWGFVSSNNDPLLTALKAIFELSWTQALLTQIVSFLANGIVSLPAAALMNRIGTVNAILFALATMALSCLLMQTIGYFQSYWGILVALFVMAAGITALQVAANPLIATLGPAKTSHFRLTFAQTFNSLGVVIGVHFGSRIMLSKEIISIEKDPLTGAVKHIADSATKSDALAAVSHSFALIGILILCLLALVFFTRGTIATSTSANNTYERPRVLDALKSRWAVFGAIAIGLYVGAEVSIGSIMINFLNQQRILNIPLDQAGELLGNIYWGGALLGRFIGSFLLTRIRATNLLAAAAGCAAILCLIVALNNGPLAGFAALSVGVFNSIMFPTIFTITLEKARVAQSSTSGLLCLAISGGALLPYLVGMIADNANLSLAFLVPLIAYAIIAFFAFQARTPFNYLHVGESQVRKLEKMAR
jgi:FHS family L-fucose permease-like MFS transporter